MKNVKTQLSNIELTDVDDVTKENIKEHNQNWSHISDHPYRKLITGSSGSGETNSLFDLISQQTYIDKVYLYAKDPINKISIVN